MRLLLDSCVASAVTQRLLLSGHDVVAVGDSPPDPGNHAILARSVDENRVLVTLDKDFGELAIAQARPLLGIIRLVSIRATLQADYLEEVIVRYAEDLGRHCLITVEPGRVRVRAPGG